MPAKQRAVISVFAAIFLPAAAASANASAYNGAAGALMPVPERRVAMLSEDIHFHQGGRWFRWHIIARYRFVNRSSKPIEVDLGFPLIARIGEGPRYRRSNPFRSSFKVRVDGRSVTAVAKRHGCKKHPRLRKGQSGRYCYDFVYLTPVRFQPGKPVEVTYSYWQRASTVNDISEWFLDYILETGAMWGGPIESATFSFRFARPTAYLYVHDRLFHRDLQDELYDCYLDNALARCRRGEVRIGAGRVRLWSSDTELTYRASCANGALHLRLHGKRILPGGNLAIGYTPAESGFDPLCKPAGAGIVNKRQSVIVAK